MKRSMAIFLAVVCGSSLGAQQWKMKDLGVGLILYDRKDAELRISREKKEWDIADLLASGALNGNPDGGEKLAVWLVGPKTSAFLDKGGMPLWSWSYSVTWPDGSVTDFGRYGFHESGFGYSLLGTGKYLSGNFKIDFWIHNRNSGEKRQVGAAGFVAVERKAAASTPLAISDLGVGLVILDADYDRELKIFDRGRGSWNIRELLDSGALNGRTDGKSHLCAWIVGPPVSTYLDESGRPKWACRYRISYPDGKTWDSSPSYFRSPGFANFELGLGGYGAGDWKVEFFIVTIDGRESWPAGSVSFSTVDE